MRPTGLQNAEAAGYGNQRSQEGTEYWPSIFGARLKITDSLLAVFTLCLVVIGARQATRLRETVNEMKTSGERQTSDMSKSIAEGGRAASAMEIMAQSVSINAQTTQDHFALIKQRSAAQMRAYLSVVVGTATYQERAKNWRFAGSPGLVNNGHTPAYNVTFRTKAEIIEFPPVGLKFDLPTEVKGGGVIGPQQNFTITAIVDDFVDDSEVEKIKNAQGKVLCVWGTINYDDAFGEPHTTEFAQFITWLPDGRIWASYSADHNKAT
jgi:hypothetical protein